MADNLVLGRGELKFAPYLLNTTTGGVFGYFGDTTDITLVQNSQKLEHYSSEHGLKEKDRSVVLQQDMTVNFTTDNINPGNLALWFGADVSGAAPADAPSGVGSLVFIGKAQSIYGALLFESDNPIGTNLNYWFPYVNLQPNGNYALKGDTWQQMSFSAEVLKRDATTQRSYAFGQAGGASTAIAGETPEFTPQSAGVTGGTIATGGTATGGQTPVHGVPFTVPFTLTGGTVAYAFLHDGTALEGDAVVISGASGNVTLTALAADTYTVKIFNNPEGTGSALVTSSSITAS